MRLLFLFITLLSCAALPGASQTDRSFSSSPLELRLRRQLLTGIVLPDSHAVVAPLSVAAPAGRSLLPDASPGISSFSLTARPLRFYGLERYELSTLDCAMMGADEGLMLGLFAGALGTSSGLFEDDSAWYMAGAMTALGAFLGWRSSDKTTTSRIRYRWREE